MGGVEEEQGCRECEGVPYSGPPLLARLSETWHNLEAEIPRFSESLDSESPDSALPPTSFVIFDK